MSIQTIKNTPDLAKAIKLRRTEFSLTIEEAASKAGVGTKTWCRYEAGNAIRTDKVKGICKTLNWKKLPDIEEEGGLSFNLEEYKQDECWSKYISET